MKEFLQLSARRVVRASVVAAVLVANGGSIAAAEPIGQPDVAQLAMTHDGWELNLSLTNLRINGVPNMAATPFTKEGFVTGKATVSILGEGAVPVDTGTLIVGVQLGCQISLNEGLDLGVGNDYNFDESPDSGLSPSLGVDLRPGTIKTLGLGTKALKGRMAAIFIHDAHVQVDGCGGPVAARLFAWAQMTTDVSDDSVSIYGELLSL